MVANKEELFVGFRSMCNERRRMGDGRYSGLHSGGVGHLHAAFLVFCPSVRTPGGGNIEYMIEYRI